MPCHFANQMEERAGQKIVLSEPANKDGESYGQNYCQGRDWTRAEVRELRQHSKDRTRVKAISRALKRTPGALRQKARALGIPLGHRRTKKKRAS